MQTSGKGVTWLTIDEDHANQRIDNYLINLLKGVPKSHIYRILRSGEIRINSKRVDANFRLASGDKVRVPPIRVAQPAQISPQKSPSRLKPHLLYEDDYLLALNKPAGMAVHGGSGISSGVIEQLRLERPQLKFLELVHRLDRDTSGILLIAKKRSTLLGLHAALRTGEVDKRYLALVRGVWPYQRKHVKLPLHTYVTASGERRTHIDAEGKAAHTIFTLQEQLGGHSLVEAELKTGRTHQIRAHLAHLQFPILGDDKYGDFALNKQLASNGLKRMFLHACRLAVQHPNTDQPLVLDAPLAKELQNFLQRLRTASG